MPSGPQSLSEGEKACVIGAGLSGLAAARALRQKDIPYDQFEMGSGVGGLWRRGHESGRSAAYENLHTITSAEGMALKGHPFPNEVPTFPSHEQVQAYAQSFADRFALKQHIRFDTKVTRAAPLDGNWEVTLGGERRGGEERRTYGAVLVATGHHWARRYPARHGSFDGTEIHARDYSRPEAFSGKDVLVVGMGNSGTGIAVDLCRTAGRVALSTRTGAWVMPKYLLGTPTDQWTGPYMERLPVWLRDFLLRVLRWITVGPQERYGVPTPGHRPLEEHPTLSEEFLAQVDHGRIEMRPDIERFEENQARFEDGSSDAFDAVIYATGYEIAFPFLPEAVSPADGQEVDLYRYVTDPAWPGLYFLGLVQPAGPLPPLAERQAQWVAELLTGTARLPDSETMKRRIEVEKRRRQSRYNPSPRHTIEVDYWNYRRQIREERAQGRRRG